MKRIEQGTFWTLSVDRYGSRGDSSDSTFIMLP